MFLLVLLCLWFGQSQQSPAKSETPANAQQQAAQSEPSAIPQQNAGQAGNNGQDNQSNSAHWSDPLVILQLLILVAIAIQAGIYGWQLRVMKAGLSETRHLVEHNKQAVEAMQGQLVAMERQADHAGTQAEVMRETLSETRRIFDLTERPVIVVESANIYNLGPNIPLSPTIVITNKGRTPAQNISVTLQIAAQAGFAYPFGFGDDKRWARPNFISFLAVGDRMLLQGAPADAITIDQDFYNRAVNDTKEFFMIHGKGTYEDLAGREYPIEYVFRYDQTIVGFRPDYGVAELRRINEKWKEQSENGETKKDKVN